MPKRNITTMRDPVPAGIILQLAVQRRVLLTVQRNLTAGLITLAFDGAGLALKENARIIRALRISPAELRRADKAINSALRENTRS